MGGRMGVWKECVGIEFEKGVWLGEHDVSLLGR